MLVRTKQNEEHTKEEKRTWASDFQVIAISPPNPFSRCSFIDNILFINKLKTDKETL